ncbi:o-succinylbenzoate--CoA ligase [Natrialbaceae archaeon AArc-T1-2]|uniref:o-succinylbenzoate--CoA ligase n=1 Tax=Natrialbaceae archaeon AArc-T1-2 TaxID=3053904 RepID=UPI00255AB298|nr:o-succinylbenzoate--CoA ligase [Natrialbaceae archaeon AArc-T1-2]WIV66138.1 o-succinylbenzoate--CoA ligase [Natrialbaceae archaeon AArc-T1-2]
MAVPVDWPTRDLLAHRARATPDRTAVIDASTDTTWTFREFDARVGGVAARLEEVVGGGDRVDDRNVRLGVLMDTRVAFATVFFAAMRRGFTVVPLNVRETTPELRAKAGRTDLDVLVCERDTEALALEAADVPVVSADETDDDVVDHLQPVADASADPVSLERTDTQLLMFTSGTSGRPKAVRLTVGNLLASAVASAFRLGVDPDDRWLCCLPMYHMGGLAPVLRSTLYGTTVVIQRSFDPDGTAGAIDEHDVTGVSLVPTMLRRLLEADWSPPETLRFVLLGGAPASEALLERCRAAGVPVYPTYGMTETASQIATARPTDVDESPGTVGQPLAFTDVTIVDDSEPVGPGETGEIVVSGPTVTPGYLADDRTDDAFDEYGLHTGDVGSRDDDGRLWVRNRVSDRIVTGGENVDPGEVVDALRAHPTVETAAVVGLPDEEWGERVAALVVPEDDSPELEELLAHCDENIAGFKRPRTVGFAEALPRTASGTVDRDAVRERLLSEGVDAVDTTD